MKMKIEKLMLLLLTVSLILISSCEKEPIEEACDLCNTAGFVPALEVDSNFIGDWTATIPWTISEFHIPPKGESAHRLVYGGTTFYTCGFAKVNPTTNTLCIDGHVWQIQEYPHLDSNQVWLMTIDSNIYHNP